MHKRKVRAILGLGVIIVIICGVAFFFVRGKDTAPVEEPVKQESIFINENTVTDPADVEVARTWEEVICEDEQKLGTITDTYLHTEPFSDSDTVVKVPMKSEFLEEATCFVGNEPLNWSKVTYNGVTGYIDLLDTEYVVEVAESIDIEVESEESEGVSEESIVDVSEEVEVEEPAEVEPTAEPTPEVKEEAPQVEATPAPSAEPQPTATPNPNVTVKTEAEKRAETPIPSEADLWAELGVTGYTTPPTTDRGLVGTSGNGTHYGDAQ